MGRTVASRIRPNYKALHDHEHCTLLDDDDDSDVDDWKHYSRFSVGSMSSVGTTDTPKHVSSVSSSDDGSNDFDEIENDVNQNDDTIHSKVHLTQENDDSLLLDEFNSALFYEEHHTPTTPLAFNLKSSWTIYVCPIQEIDRSLVKAIPQENPTTTTIFRLVRNSEPSSALYVHGMEIIYMIDSIYDRDHTVTFSIIIQIGSTQEIYVTDYVNDVRTKLYKCMLPSEITFHPRPQQHHCHHHNNNDEVAPLTPMTKSIGTTIRHDKNEVFRFSSAEYHDMIRNNNNNNSNSNSNSNNGSSQLEHSTLRRRCDSSPMIESKLEFDDYNMDEYSNHVNRCNDTENIRNNFGGHLSENAMLHDVVTSLLAVRIRDGSSSSSHWSTLSSSSSSLDNTNDDDDDEADDSTDNYSESGSEMEMAEI
jgi:hypothetical protein